MPATTTNNGVSCATACTFAWDFGDGTSGTGQNTTHQFRTISSFQVRLTVTDARGATALAVRTVPVAPGAPPTNVSFTMSPANPGVNQDIFFDASASAPAPGRTFTSYAWNFGDGSTGSGVVDDTSLRGGGQLPGIAHGDRRCRHDRPSVGVLADWSRACGNADGGVDLQPDDPEAWHLGVVQRQRKPSGHRREHRELHV